MRNDNSKGMGYGWRLSAHQELKASGIKDYPYYYVDGDGTKHYFYKDTSDGNKLKDEDGLGYVITRTSSTNEDAYFVMETKAKVKMEFHRDGMLRKETDLNGNSIYYYYSSGKLTHLCEAGRNGAIDHIICLTYGSDNNLAYITDETGRKIHYTYENGNLRTIVYPDALTEDPTSYKTSRYGYSTSGHELMYVKAPDGYEMDYTYITDCGVRRVRTIKEGKNSAYGQEIRITYHNGMQTVYEEPGIDGKLSREVDNRTYAYQFDNCGRVRCVSDQDGNGASYDYFVQGQKNHKVSLQGATMKTANNGVLNSRFQDGTLNNWTKYPAGTGQVSVDTAAGYIGKSSVKIARTGIADSITAVQQSVPLGEGAYTVSAYVKVSDLTTKASDTDTGTDRFVGISVKAMEGTDAQYYYYIYNVQGDVIGLVDKSGAKVVTYIYDSWGKLLPGSTSSTLASLNPFRYRGYCYDEETGLYYLKTRYYDPEVGRFISADIPEALTANMEKVSDKNLYAYCEDNPVNLTDETGMLAALLGCMATGALIGAVVGAVASVASQMIFEKKVDGRKVFNDSIAAALSGALAVTGVRMAGQVVGNAAISSVNYLINEGDEATGGGLIESAALGAIGGAIGGAGLDLKNKMGIVRYSKTVINSAKSQKKILQYTAKICSVLSSTKTAARKFLASAVVSSFGGKIKNLIIKVIQNPKSKIR